MHFHRETEADIRERKEAALKSINPVSASGLEITTEDFFIKEFDFPKRPPWKFDMSVEQLEDREHRYFTVGIMFNLEFVLVDTKECVAGAYQEKEHYCTLHYETFFCFLVVIPTQNLPLTVSMSTAAITAALSCTKPIYTTDLRVCFSAAGQLTLFHTTVSKCQPTASNKISHVLKVHIS